MHLFRELESLIVSDAGFPYWLGRHVVDMVQFRDNILMATDAPRRICKRGRVSARYTPRGMGPPVVCDCITDTRLTCIGARCGPVCKAMGVVPIRSGTGSGMAFIETSSVTPEWTLKLRPPLLSPHSKYTGYLGAIFTGVLKNGLPFFCHMGLADYERRSMAQCCHAFWLRKG